MIASAFPVSSTIYLEKVLRRVRQVLYLDMNSNEIEYAYDVDFITSKSYVDLDKITPIMNKYNLIINKDKTE